LNLQTKDNAR